MQKIINGIKQFQSEVYPNLKDRFEQLASSQAPEVLFITCSDSRIDPNLVTQTGPGELFVCRNAGNIVPPHQNDNGGMSASIEYAVSVLGVKHIVICGHSNCGAMKAAMNPESVDGLPQVKPWLEHCCAAKEAVEAEHGCIKDEHLDEVTKQNIVLQLTHLTAHPAVHKKLHTKEVELHGWVYDIETGKIEGYDSATQQFSEL